MIRTPALSDAFPALRLGEAAVLLAPMEGVTDAPMRAFQARRGGFRFCVSEFIRVSQDVIPQRVFRSEVPECRAGFRTDAGTAIQVQLLGGHPERLALSAREAVAAGATAIDLNFGCPAPTVNRHDGGATLLNFPDRITAIVRGVRDALPAEIPVSAKLRLGWDDLTQIDRNSAAAEEGGASWITIHARTRMQGYRPPAHWTYIRGVRERLGIPVVANGEIWTLDDFRRCRDATGCEHFMLGRGALGDPALAGQIARELRAPEVKDVHLREDYAELETWLAAFREFETLSEMWADAGPYALARMKQWLRYGEVGGRVKFFAELKRAQSLPEFYAILQAMIAVGKTESSDFRASSALFE